MRHKEPEKLPARTPTWFREWHNGSFWHFKYEVESKLAFQGRLLWTILGAILVVSIANIFL